MTDILENELVLKYWGCDHYRGMCVMWVCRNERAYNVLRAMQEPIRKGERYLEWIYEECGLDGAYEERTCRGISGTSQLGQIEEYFDRFHPRELRLPDRFQAGKKCCCGQSNVVHRIDGPCYHIDQPSPAQGKCYPPVHLLCPEHSGCMCACENKTHKPADAGRCECNCHPMGTKWCSHCLENHKSNDSAKAVEAKIQEISNYYVSVMGIVDIKVKLRELVALVKRGTK